jgi:hypothetical protein
MIRIEEKRNACRVLVGKHEGKIPEWKTGRMMLN